MYIVINRRRATLATMLWGATQDALGGILKSSRITGHVSIIKKNPINQKPQITNPEHIYPPFSLPRATCTRTSASGSASASRKPAGCSARCARWSRPATSRASCCVISSCGSLCLPTVKGESQVANCSPTPPRNG